MNRKLKALLLLAAISLGVVAGCGDSKTEYAGQPNPGLPGIVVDNDGSISAPGDSSITSLKLTISPEYDQNTGMVNIYTLVTDQDDNVFEAMNKYNFNVTMNAGTGPRVTNMSDFNVLMQTIGGVTDHTVALGLDNSGSMASVDFLTGKTSMEIAKEASVLYVDNMKSTDRAGIIKFSTAASILQPLTKNKQLLYDAIATLEPDGATNIGDAVAKCADAIGVYPGRTAIVVMTDGGDTEGMIDQGIAAAKRVKVPVFTIGLGAGVFPDELIRIAEETGGQYFEASTTDLGDVFANTIPAAIDTLPIRSVQSLTVPVSTPMPDQFNEVSVSITVTLKFKNARKTHVATASGNFIIQQ